MFERSEEMCLNNYFMLEYIAGDWIDKAKYFGRLCEIFFLTQKEAAKLYAVTQTPQIKEIESEREYMQSLRVDQYCALMKREFPYASDVRAMITVKGNAITSAAKLGFKPCRESTENAVYGMLSDSADAGSIRALAVLGLLRCEGFFGPRDVKFGARDLDKAARWNDLDSILFSLFFDSERRDENMRRLYTLTRKGAYGYLYEHASMVYGISSPDPLFETKLMEKAFNTEKAKREQFNPQIARVAYSSLLSDGDKEKVLFGDLKTSLADICDLPLKLRYRDIPCVDVDAHVADLTGEGRILRSDRLSEIVCGVQNSDLRNLDSYMPMCVVSDSEYLLDAYAEAISHMLGRQKITRIDVANLTETDFESSRNNVFVRSIDEDCDNVYLMFFAGEIRETTLANAAAFLNSRVRKNYLLSRHGVALDLGAVLPICFCDRRNYRAISDSVVSVNVRNIGAKDKKTAIEDVLSRKKRQYALSGLTVSDGAKSELMSMPVDEIARLVDRVMSVFRRGGKQLDLTAEMIAKCGGVSINASQYGFGGEKYVTD